MRPGVNVIVVNYQCPGDLQGFLDSLDVQCEHDLCIGNVVPTPRDSAVTDGYTRSARRFEWSENIGYARAANVMAAAGDREVIAIFNADVLVKPGSIEACYEALISHDDWDILGPLQVDQRGRATHAGIFGSNTAPKHRGWMMPGHLPEYQDVREAVTVSGSAYFIKRYAWEELAECDDCNGAFLPTPLYFEETWCSYHARAHSFKVMYYGAVSMIHKYHKAIENNEQWAKQQWRISQQMFRDACDKHGIEHD